MGEAALKREIKMRIRDHDLAASQADEWQQRALDAERRVTELRDAMEWARCRLLTVNGYTEREDVIGIAATAREHLAAALAQHDQGVECEHEWIDIRNKYVESGEMCRKCRLARAGNEATADQPENPDA